MEVRSELAESLSSGLKLDQHDFQYRFSNAAGILSADPTLESIVRFGVTSARRLTDVPLTSKLTVVRAPSKTDSARTFRSGNAEVTGWSEGEVNKRLANAVADVRLKDDHPWLVLFSNTEGVEIVAELARLFEDFE